MAGTPVPLHRLAAGATADGHVRLHVLLTWFQTGVASVVTDAVLVAALLTYVWAAHHRARRRRWPRRRTVAFAAGLLAVFVAVGSGLAAYDDVNPSAHVVQHMILMSVAPPLLVAARPLTLLLQGAPRRHRARLVRLVGGRPARALTGPLAWLAMPALMAVFFLTPVYAASERSALLHDASHGVFLLAGYLAWNAVIGVDAAGQRGHLQRLVTVMVSMTLEAAVGAAFVLARHPLDPSVTLAATRRAGQALWMLSMLSCGWAMAIVLRQWIAADERRVRRWEQEQARTAAAGIRPAPTTPPRTATPVATLPPPLPTSPRPGA